MVKYWDPVTLETILPSHWHLSYGLRNRGERNTTLQKVRADLGLTGFIFLSLVPLPPKKKKLFNKIEPFGKNHRKNYSALTHESQAIKVMCQNFMQNTSALFQIQKFLKLYKLMWASSGDCTTIMFRHALIFQHRFIFLRNSINQ